MATAPPLWVTPETAAAANEEPAAEAAKGVGDNKRKLEEVDAVAEADGARRDAKRPHVQGNGTAAEKFEVVAADSEEGGTSAKQEIIRLVDVPHNKMDALIGKGAEMIRSLQVSSGARIQINIDEDVPPAALTRSVELIGTSESIDKAEQLIKIVMAKAEAADSSGHSGLEQLDMIVPETKAGYIFGRRGETIKHLQNTSGAQIQLIPQHPPVGITLTERTVRFVGNKKQIQDAKELVKQAMNQRFSRNTTQSGRYGPQRQHPQGHAAASQWGPEHSHPPKGPQPQNAPYSQAPYALQSQPRGSMCSNQGQALPPHSLHLGRGGNCSGNGDPGYSSTSSQQYYGQPPADLQQGYLQHADPYARQWPPSGGAPAGDDTYQAQQPSAYGQTYPVTGPDGYTQHQGGQAPGAYGQSTLAGPGYIQQAGDYEQFSHSLLACGDQSAQNNVNNAFYGNIDGGTGQWPPRGGAPAGDGAYQAPHPASYRQTYPAIRPDGNTRQGYLHQVGQAPGAYGESALAGTGYSPQDANSEQFPQFLPAFGYQDPKHGNGHQYAVAPPRGGAPVGDTAYQAQHPAAYGQTYPAIGADGNTRQGYLLQAGQALGAYGQSAPAGIGYSPQDANYAQFPQSLPALCYQDPKYANAHEYPVAPETGQPGPGYGQAGYPPTDEPTKP